MGSLPFDLRSKSRSRSRRSFDSDSGKEREHGRATIEEKDVAEQQDKLFDELAVHFESRFLNKSWPWPSDYKCAPYLLSEALAKYPTVRDWAKAKSVGWGKRNRTEFDMHAATVDESIALYPSIKEAARNSRPIERICRRLTGIIDYEEDLEKKKGTWTRADLGSR